MSETPILDMQAEAARRLKQERAGRFAAVWWDNITFEPRSDTFVKGLLGTGTMSVIYGESGCGKSFFASHLAMHVALGWNWWGRKVRQGVVIYIAAEGGTGMKKRIAAFRQHHAITQARVPFLLIPTAVNLLDPKADVNELVLEIEAAAKAAGMPVLLIVIDTLSRAMAGGNENAPDDMGAFVMNCDRIRQAAGAHVAIVHHSGKEAGRGARGHSLLRAATDTEIEIRKDAITGIATATVTKQKDGEDGDEFAFELQQVRLGEDEDGEPITSCVVIGADPIERTATARVQLSPANQTALDLLRKAIAEAGEQPPASNHVPAGVRAVQSSLWRSYCYAGQVSTSDDPDAKRKAFGRAAQALTAKRMVATWGDWVWITAPGQSGT